MQNPTPAQYCTTRKASPARNTLMLVQAARGGEREKRGEGSGGGEVEVVAGLHLLGGVDTTLCSKPQAASTHKCAVCKGRIIRCRRRKLFTESILWRTLEVADRPRPLAAQVLPHRPIACSFTMGPLRRICLEFTLVAGHCKNRRFPSVGPLAQAV